MRILSGRVFSTSLHTTLGDMLVTYKQKIFTGFRMLHSLVREVTTVSHTEQGLIIGRRHTHTHTIVKPQRLQLSLPLRAGPQKTLNEGQRGVMVECVSGETSRGAQIRKKGWQERVTGDYATTKHSTQ